MEEKDRVCGKDNCCENPSQCGAEVKTDAEAFALVLEHTRKTVEEFGDKLKEAAEVLKKEIDVIGPLVEKLPESLVRAWFAFYQEEMKAVQVKYQDALK